jgi:hypothetical protein
MPNVTGHLISADGTDLLTTVKFTTISAPVESSGSMVSVTEKRVNTDSGGDFSLTLEAGDYTVEWFNGEKLTEIIVAVPAGGGPYTLTNITEGSLTYTRTVEPEYMLKSDAGQSFRLHNGHLEIYNYTTEQWNPIVNTGAAGSERIGLGGAS